jgi:hypothetical protein
MNFFHEALVLGVLELVKDLFRPLWARKILLLATHTQFTITGHCN